MARETSTQQREPRVLTDARGHNVWVGEPAGDVRGLQIVGTAHSLTTDDTRGLELLEPQGYDPYDSTRHR